MRERGWSLRIMLESASAVNGGLCAGCPGSEALLGGCKSCPVPPRGRRATVFYGLRSFQYDTLLQTQLGPVGLAASFHTVGCGVPNLARDKQRSASLAAGEINISSLPFASARAGQDKESQVMGGDAAWPSPARNRNGTARLLTLRSPWSPVGFFPWSGLPVAAGRVCFADALFPEIRFSGWWPPACRKTWFYFCCAADVQPCTVFLSVIL